VSLLTLFPGFGHMASAYFPYNMYNAAVGRRTRGLADATFRGLERDGETEGVVCVK